MTTSQQLPKKVVGMGKCSLSLAARLCTCEYEVQYRMQFRDSANRKRSLRTCFNALQQCSISASEQDPASLESFQARCMILATDR